MTNLDKKIRLGRADMAVAAANWLRPENLSRMRHVVADFGRIGPIRIGDQGIARNF
jgi:hypothetical protein